MTEKLTKFDYLLNAMEAAAMEKNPAAFGYAEKRRALYAYVRGLENRPSPFAPPADPQAMPEIQVGDMVAMSGYDHQLTAYQVDTEKEAGEWMTSQYRDDILAIYRDPLWRRPQAMPTKELPRDRCGACGGPLFACECTGIENRAMPTKEQP